MLNKNSISRLLLACAFVATSSLGYGQLIEGHYGEFAVPNNYDGGVRANEGFFCTFNALFWQLPTPKNGIVGNAGVAGSQVFWNSEKDSTYTTPDQTWQDGETYNPDIGRTYLGTAVVSGQLNSWNADTFSDNWATGQKYTFGFMNGHWGWDCQIFTITGSSNMYGRGVQVGFDDKAGFLMGYVLLEGDEDNSAPARYQLKGNERLGVSFAQARMFNEIQTWGVEFNLLHRNHATSIGIFEFGLGVRYMKWDERFGFNGYYDYYTIYDEDGAETTQRISWGVLDNSRWTARGENNLIGPQLGVRWFRQTGRFSLALSGKFLAAYNAQRVNLSGVLGSLNPNGYIDGTDGYGETYYQGQIPPYGLTVTSRKETFNEFTPMVEFGVNMNFQITRKFSVELGWTGIYAMDMLRPMGMVDYTLSPGSIMGVFAEANRENVFVHGFNVGLLFNR